MLDPDISDDEDPQHRAKMTTKPVTRSLSSEARAACRGAGFGSTPRQLRMADFGCPLPSANRLHPGENGVRQMVLIGTLRAFEEASPTGRFHVLGQQNRLLWKMKADAAAGRRLTSPLAAAPPAAAAGLACEVLVLPGDWGVVALEMTRKFGATFAVLNMANAYWPGGGYVDGMVAQEENMFRRTDCHFSLSPEEMEPDRESYLPAHSELLNAKHGKVYLDVTNPRVCVRGPEERSRSDLGYAWLPDAEIFPFYELRAAACDLRDGSRFDPAETAHRVGAMLDTLIELGVRHAVLSAFGCGAFMNPAHRVAVIYRQELDRRAHCFDVVAFGIFHAGYGPSNFEPFRAAFADWPGRNAEGT